MKPHNVCRPYLSSSCFCSFFQFLCSFEYVVKPNFDQHLNILRQHCWPYIDAPACQIWSKNTRRKGCVSCVNGEKRCASCVNGEKGCASCVNGEKRSASCVNGEKGCASCVNGEKRSASCANGEKGCASCVHGE